MRACFLALAQDHGGMRLIDMPSGIRPHAVTLLEKIPRNALAILFLLKLFPDMRILFLHRDPEKPSPASWKRGSLAPQQDDS